MITERWKWIWDHPNTILLWVCRAIMIAGTVIVFIAFLVWVLLVWGVL